MKEEIRRVSFYIWEGQRLKHMEEIVKIQGREKIFDKLKDKYGDDMVHVRKVWDYA
tara:strand:+ start:52 stop:219 length:168 start_codon:yes stop_codon:yes gene_type:complete